MTCPSDDLIVRLDPDLEEIIPFFLELRRQNIAEIVAAVNGEDFERVRWLGHNIKGAGGSYGFTRVSAIGLALERAARSADATAIRRLAEELAAYLDRVEIRFD